METRRTAKWLFMLLGVPAAEPPRASPPPLLVAVESAGGMSLLLHPVAVMADSGFADPGYGDERDSSSARFAATYFRAGQRYRLTAGGRFIGTARVDSTLSAGCVGIDAVATGSAAPGSSLESARLGTFGSPSWSGSLDVRPFSSRERVAFRQILADTLRMLGTAPDLVRVAALGGAVYGTAGADTLVALALLNTPDTAADGKVVSALVIAELMGSRAIPVLTIGPDSLASDVHARVLLDAFDIDRDGWPELLVKDSYSEGWAYTVYRRRGGRWSAWYHGGGGGC